MAVPSFEELLNQARQISQYKADQAGPQTGELLASGLAGLGHSFLNAPIGEKQTYVGAVNPTTSSYTAFQTPQQVGGTVSDLFARNLFGKTPEATPVGSVPITQTQFAEKGLTSIFKPKASLEKTLGEVHPGMSNEELNNLYGMNNLTPTTTFNQLKAEKPRASKTLISNNEFVRRTKAGETLSTDKYQVVPESYAGAGSPIVEQNKQKIIKSYQDALLADPTIKELKDQGLSLGASQGLVDLAKQGNQVAFVSLGAKQAKVMGEKGMLSQTDVTRYVEAGSLSRSAGDKLLKWIGGTPTDATLDEINQISGVLKDSFEKAVQPYIEKHAKQMSEGMGIPIEDAYRYLAEPMPVKETIKKAKTEGTKSVGKAQSILDKYGIK